MNRLWSLALAFTMIVLATGPSAHAAGGDGEHGEHHQPFNLSEGLLVESSDSEPSLLTREPGTPPPYAAMLINSAILFALLFFLGGPKLRSALAQRKADLMRGMEEAASMRTDAEKRLKEYKKKLKRVDSEIEATRQQIREAGEADRGRVLAEAKEKRERMERDAKRLIEQELKAAREALQVEAIHNAIATASQAMAAQVSASDRERLQQAYITQLSASLDGRGQA